MKIELRCPSCSERYLVERSMLPAEGGEMPCLECGSTIPVDIRDLEDRTAPGAGATTLAPDPVPAAAAAPAAGVARAASTGPGSGRGGEEVVCPRCKLHFVPRKAHADAVAAAQGGDRPTVLVVEDMDYFQEIARESLGARFEVRTAGTIDEARAALAAGGVDLMIIDLTLEGGDQGMALLRELQPKRFPILVFTAQDESEMYSGRWEELQALGADDLVRKGMNVGEVLLRKAADLLGIELAEEDVP